MARLIVMLSDKPYCELELQGKDVTLGSDKGDDVVLPDERVSTRHAELRFQQGQYIVFDLASETGVLVNGQRVHRAVLAPGVSATIGPFRLLVDLATAASASAVGARDAPTMYAGQSGLAGEMVKVREDQAPGPAVGAPPPHSKAGKSGKAKPQQTGLVARLARLPKPVLFGGFSFLLMLILALKVLTTPTDNTPAVGSMTASKDAAQIPVPAAPDNKQAIAEHLKDGKARMERAENEAAIREDLDPILLIDKTNAEALSLKAEAEERLAKLAAPAQPDSRPAGGDTAPRTEPAELQKAEPSPGQSTVVRRPPPPERGGVTLRPDETPDSWQERMRSLATRYSKAVTAIGAADYATAAATLDSIIQEEPRYRDAGQRALGVRQAQAGLAKAAFDAALALEQEDELIKARTEFERACGMPQAPVACAEARKRIAGKIQNAGDEAFRRAKFFDTQGRLPEAIALYQRAFELLGADDPNRQIAQERFTLLKSRR